MLGSCSIIIRKAPGREEATLGVRAAWAMLTNAGLEVSLVFMGDGVYSAFAGPGYLRGLLERFCAESDTAFVVREDLEERGLDVASLPEGVRLTSAAEVGDMVQDTESILTF